MSKQKQNEGPVLHSELVTLRKRLEALEARERAPRDPRDCVL